MSTPARIALGDGVKVIDGVTDPDIDASIKEDHEWWDPVSMAGWHGVVTRRWNDEGR